MPRKSKLLPFDANLAAGQLVELGVQRRQFIKARIRVLNAAGALVRRSLGWNPNNEESDNSKINKKAAKIMASEDFNALPSDLAEIAIALAPHIATARSMAQPGEVMQHQIELTMKRIARQFPVWEWVKDIKGLSDLGLAIIIAEAGPLDKYSSHSKLWRRLGLAPITKNGETRAGSTWRMKGGLNAADWTTAGYSARRRAAIFSQVGNPIIGGMGKGYRPTVGEDIEQNEKLSHYEKVFVRRLRYEAAKDSTLRRENTEAGKESFSKICAAKAQYYAEKRLIRDLWKAWRRAVRDLSEGTRVPLPADEITDAPSGAAEAVKQLSEKTAMRLPPHQFTDAPQGAGQASIYVQVLANDRLPDPQSRDASWNRGAP